MSTTLVPLPALIGVPRDVLYVPERAARLEWLETDGRGGYASGTAIGANTRRYHGLVVVAKQPPADRVVLLSRVEETLVLENGERFDLGVNFYPGTLHPRGDTLLESFALDPWPMWRYRAGSVELLKEVFVSRLARATVFRYQVRGGPGTLEIKPLIAGRDFHGLTSAREGMRRDAEVSERIVAYQMHDDVPPFVMSFHEAEWEPNPHWYFNTIYPRETERGLPDREDLFCPGLLRVTLDPSAPTVIACGARAARIANAGLWVAEELKRRGRAAEAGRVAAGQNARLSDLAARLGLAADAFLVERGAGRTIIAGYPWFGGWARDAMISLPGLCIATGRLDDAASVLRSFASQVDNGLLPNRFPEPGGAVPDDHCDSVDAPLWFIEAVARVHDEGGPIDEFWPAVKEILAAFERGTRFGIRMDDDGLITQGNSTSQLTWMDACIDGDPVTPRTGKAVEVNALWYNALRRAASLAASRSRATYYEALADRCRSAFDKFWLAENGYLCDVIDPAGRRDPALRPNQLFAISLPNSPLDPDRARRVLDAVQHALLVPLGLRTLAPQHPGYAGHFDGSLRRLDRACHNGAAWPWLFGAFARAYLRVHGETDEARDFLETLFRPFEMHIDDFGLGHVAEVVSGDPPHTAGGCFAQAWSCAELLDAIARVCNPARHAR